MRHYLSYHSLVCHVEHYTVLQSLKVISFFLLEDNKLLMCLPPHPHPPSLNSRYIYLRLQGNSLRALRSSLASKF